METLTRLGEWEVTQQAHDDAWQPKKKKNIKQFIL